MASTKPYFSSLVFLRQPSHSWISRLALLLRTFWTRRSWARGLLIKLTLSNLIESKYQASSSIQIPYWLASYLLAKRWSGFVNFRARKDWTSLKKALRGFSRSLMSIPWSKDSEKSTNSADFTGWKKQISSQELLHVSWLFLQIQKMRNKVLILEFKRAISLQVMKITLVGLKTKTKAHYNLMLIQNKILKMKGILGLPKTWAWGRIHKFNWLQEPKIWILCKWGQMSWS